MQAGVSVGTVSRVLNGYQNISQENLERVQKAIVDLGYQRNSSAGLLASRRKGSLVRTGNIGVIYTEMDKNWTGHPLVSAYSMGAERACQEKGYHAIIEFCNNGDELPRCVSENKIDGLLVKATRSLPEFVRVLAGELPIVCVGMNDPAIEIQQVASDNYGCGWMAMKYLWDRGHRRVAFACTDIVHPMFLARFQGYEGFLRSKGCFDASLCCLQQPPEIILAPELTPPDMDFAVAQLENAAGGFPTAIITANDWMACGLYPSLEAKGYRIPSDVSVLGFDSVGLICTSLRPHLSSFEIPFEGIAYTAALKVIERISSPAQDWDKSLHLIRGGIVERASVRPVTD